MSANQSDLSASKYGYDFVVATTQRSINNSIRDYLWNTSFNLMKVYWNQDPVTNAPVRVSYEDLMVQTNGTDPLDVPSYSEGPPSQDIINIENSMFYFAFEAMVGIPDGMDESDVPDLITFNNDQSVLFKQICSTLKIASCEFSRSGMTFSNISQPDDDPWLFVSTVPLSNQSANSDEVPKNVNDTLAQLNKQYGPNAFSVQQLVYNFDNAAIESSPSIASLIPGSDIDIVVSEVLVSTYFEEVKAAGQPVLNYNIVQNPQAITPASLNMTALELEISDYDPGSTQVSQQDIQDLSTLNYLCAVDGKRIPPPVKFDWNWVEANEEFDGIVSVNRNSFAGNIEAQLDPYVTKNCNTPVISVYPDGLECKYSWDMASGTPTKSKPSTGAEVLDYSFYAYSEDGAGLGDFMGTMAVSDSFSLSVTFSGNTIQIAQSIEIRIDMRVGLDSESWSPVRKTITDTYTLGVDNYGQLTAALVSVPKDTSEATPQQGGIRDFFTNFNDIVSDATTWASSVANTSFMDIPVDVVQQFVFPGGNTFSYHNVLFSENQDLTSSINYLAIT
ncbi:MAG: hypothetical protein PSV16_14975 [Flavobacterium sp.]|nr:hypothetical protein [Flavobacterium sp.]